MSTVEELVERAEKLDPSDQIALLKSLAQSKAMRSARLAALRSDLEVGIRQADAGLTKPLDAEGLKRRLNERLAAKGNSP
jgi:hypothetical protein